MHNRALPVALSREMSNVHVDTVASSEPPRTAWERLQHMDILNGSSRDFTVSQSQIVVALGRPKSVDNVLLVVPIPNACGNVGSLETLSAGVSQQQSYGKSANNS